MIGLSFLRALLIVMAASAATPPQINTARKCFVTAPGNVTRSGTTLKIGVRPWISHQLGSAVMEIILKEFMGFTVAAYDLKDSDSKKWARISLQASTTLMWSREKLTRPP